MAEQKQSKKGATQVSLNIEEAKEFLKHIVSNNNFIQGKGKIPVATEIVGDSGIGKTSITLQLARELGLSHIKLNLAQIEELGDLVGFPIRQFQMERIEEGKEKEIIWVDDHAVTDFTKDGYKLTRKNRMSYCPPEWIADKTNGGILILDDWNRADMRFIQAVMELIDRQQYMSWKLPENWHIVLTSNPSDGEYMVNEIDPAQRTRFISVNLKFDTQVWGKWAEKEQLDGRCINFLLKHPELITPKVNARSAVMFFNSISSLDSFEGSLPIIQMIGEGSVGPEFTSMFTTFINNKLDKLISPEDIIFHPDEKYVISSLKKVCGDIKTKDGDKYRADIAAIISTRIINYVLVIAEKDPKRITKDVITRITNLVLGELFAPDLCYNITKNIYGGNTKLFAPMMLNKALSSHILK